MYVPAVMYAMHTLYSGVLLQFYALLHCCSVPLFQCCLVALFVSNPSILGCNKRFFCSILLHWRQCRSVAGQWPVSGRTHHTFAVDAHVQLVRVASRPVLHLRRSLRVEVVAVRHTVEGTRLELADCQRQ